MKGESSGLVGWLVMGFIYAYGAQACFDRISTLYRSQRAERLRN